AAGRGNPATARAHSRGDRQYRARDADAGRILAATWEQERSAAEARLVKVVPEPAPIREFGRIDASEFQELRGRRQPAVFRGLAPFLDRLLRDRGEPTPFAMAVQSEAVQSLLPGFEAENRIDVLHRHVPARAWIGNRIQVAPHYDLQENVGVVVAGRRRFTVFPPDQLPNLYPGPFELTPAGTPISMVDPHHPDLERYPRFAKAMEVAQSAELAPGDAIYIPYHWWHGVDSLEPVNLFVNYWWNDRPPGAGDPYDALMWAFFALKVLPPEQREVWRMIFDHYVFCSNGDPG